MKQIPIHIRNIRPVSEKGYEVDIDAPGLDETQKVIDTVNVDGQIPFVNFRPDPMVSGVFIGCDANDIKEFVKAILDHHVKRP